MNDVSWQVSPSLAGMGFFIEKPKRKKKKTIIFFIIYIYNLSWKNLEERKCQVIVGLTKKFYGWLLLKVYFQEVVKKNVVREREVLLRCLYVRGSTLTPLRKAKPP